LNHDDALRSSTSFSTKYALHVELDRKPDRIQLCGERQLCPVVSTGRRNTLIFLERWSVYHEVSATNVLYRCAKVGDVGSLSAMHASPAGSGWQRGESLSSIGRGFNRASSSIYPLLARTGGIRPAERVRSRLSLTLIEREEISRGLLGEMSLRSIARSLKLPASTISREVRRNGGTKLYRAASSDAAAWDRTRRPKLCKSAGKDYLCRAISAKLIRKCSPQQIAGWLMRAHPDDESRRVSHETIYRSLFIQTRGVLKKELLAHLRATRSIRRSRHATLKRSGLGQIMDTISIKEKAGRCRR
jgi:hypothetical protein